MLTHNDRERTRGDDMATVTKPEVDAAAQRDARDAIMQIPAFPELQTRLTRVFGPGAERDMIHQLVYWFSKPKMQNRWWAYKTLDEWRDERGLNRKQVDKARRRLKPFGVVEEKKGNYKRIHYCIDWVRLAELLSIPLKGGQSYDWDNLEDEDFFDEPLIPLKGGQSQNDTPKGGSIENDPPQMEGTPDTYAENPSNGGGQTNARENAGEYLQDNSLLQRAAEPALAEPAAPEINRNEEPQEGNASSPDADKRHSQERDPRSETTAARDRVDGEAERDRRFIRAALEEPTPELREALERHRNGEMDLSTLTDTMRRKTYLRGSMAWSSLRPGQVAEVLAELGLTQEEVAA
jgi:hypothetical protein